MKYEQEENLNEQISLQIEKLEQELGHKSLYGVQYPESNDEPDFSDGGGDLKTIPQIKVSYQRPGLTDMVKITDSEVAASHLRSIFEPGTIDLRERFVVLFLNKSNHALGYYILSLGGVSDVGVDIAFLTALALGSRCTGIVICHNRIDGELEPNKGDIAITRQIKHSLAFFYLRLIDHVLLSTEGHLSMAEKGLI